MVCNRITVAAAIATGSTLDCGIEPCAPRPNKRSAAVGSGRFEAMSADGLACCLRHKHAGSDWRPKGAPQRIKVHDFEDKKLGKVAPYGVYDIAADAGWVSVGITCDTAEFAVASSKGSAGRAIPRHAS
jgi:hypothetical protein